MILNNTQANIFKVNGALADNIANQPNAIGSYYLYYSLDTQEIFYDESPGNWVRLGVGGGTLGQNIYNSSGTLTGSRELDGAYNTLLFKNVSQLSFSSINNAVNTAFISFLVRDTNLNQASLLFDPNSVQFFAQNFNTNQGVGLSMDRNNQNIQTLYNTNRQGIYFQFNSQRYQFGHIFNNGITLQIENATSQLTILCNPIQSGGSSNGIFLDLTNNRNYLFGQFNGGSQTHLRVSDLNSQITGNFSGSVNGIRLAQSTHTFGFISGTNTNVLRFNSNLTVGFYYNNLLNGLNIQHESTISGLERYDFGRLYGASNTQYKITLTDLSCFLNYKSIAQWGFTASQAEFGFYPGLGSNILLDSSGNINLRQLTQILINGTGITQGTSGSASGQHLKVRINNVDYVIELKNP